MNFIASLKLEMKRKGGDAWGTARAGETNVLHLLQHISSTPAPRQASSLERNLHLHTFSLSFSDEKNPPYMQFTKRKNAPSKWKGRSLV